MRKLGEQPDASLLSLLSTRSLWFDLVKNEDAMIGIVCLVHTACSDGCFECALN
jgi:hypothetical protein